jgi:hypothetical protein
MCADMSTWDFSEDLDCGLDFYFGNNPVPQVADKTTSYERQKELNRTAQQRTRQKKKVREVSHFQPGGLTILASRMSPRRLVSTMFQERSSSIEAQLAETTDQLHDLRLRQSQLKAQNHLLELAVPNNHAGLPASVPQQSLQVK